MRTPKQLASIGILLGTVFLAFSLTPSLLPRSYLAQGVLSGLSFTAGYGLGVFGNWLWTYLELPVPSRRAQRIGTLGAAAVCALIAMAFLWQATAWQNDVRTLMEMAEVSSVRPLSVGLITAVAFLVLLALARLFRWTFLSLSRRLQRYIPQRIAHALGIAVAVVVFWSVANGVLFKLALQATDASYERLDALIEPDRERPSDPMKAGSSASLIDWRDMGRQGRNFIKSQPSQSELSAFTEGKASVPIRVYVGLNAAETPEARAQLALEELKRVGAFERSVLLLVTPTGTGWVDPAALAPLEYLHRGDVASVAAQYSYLPSPVSLWVEGHHGAVNARALFEQVYGYWTKLPATERPALYLHGLSLGALNSDHSFDLYDIIDDPFQGVLWSGPPFRSATWQTVTARRDPGSPAWLPEFRDGSVVRFMNQYTSLERGEARWGPFRIAFLQYASDPVTFFEPSALYKKPVWMTPPRGPDVSPHMRWFPVVTMLQLAADMALGNAPVGYGHNYAAADYVDAWWALTEPSGWTETELSELKSVLGEA